MRRSLLILVVALAAGLFAFVWMRGQSTAEAPRGSLLEAMPELAWLRGELHLSDSQFQKASALHAAYLPECEAMCRRIVEAHARMEKAAGANDELTPELESALEDHARIHAECQKKMLAHLYETARILDDKQAKRYLEVMLPYALDFSQSEPEHVHVR